MGFIKSIFKNMFDIGWYKENNKKTLSEAIKYSMLLTFVFAVLFNATVCFMLYGKLVQPAVAYVEEMPNFNLSSAGLTVDSPVPFVQKGDKYLIEVNDNANVGALEGKYKDQSKDFKLLIGQDGFFLAKQGSEPNLIMFNDVSELKGVTLTKDDFLNSRVIHTIFSISMGIFFVLSLLFALIGTLFRAFIYSVFMMVIAELRNVKNTFDDCFKLSLFATTFYIVFWGILALLPLPASIFGRSIILHLISLFILWKALNIVSEDWEVSM